MEVMFFKILKLCQLTLPFLFISFGNHQDQDHLAITDW